jgi:hypothetical protein
MSFLIHGAPACAQLDRAFACFERHQNASASAHRLRHQLEWSVTSKGQHLHRVDTESGRVIADLGPRCAALERLHDDHRDRRTDAMSMLATCTSELRQSELQNVAAGVSRVPPLVIRILDSLRLHGLLDYYRVIGTYALFAYEAAAKVVLSDDTTATNDVDLLWDVQARLSFVARFTDPPSSMIDVLRAADPSFERNEDQKESAINSAGFSVDFDQIVVGANGRMALMRTIDPVTFIHVKRWISEKSSRDAIKRMRDRHQADVVQSLIDTGRLRSALSARLA